MTTARPLTPPEVRELLRAVDAVISVPITLSSGLVVNGFDAGTLAAAQHPAIRATLELYAELAETHPSSLTLERIRFLLSECHIESQRRYAISGGRVDWSVDSEAFAKLFLEMLHALESADARAAVESSGAHPGNLQRPR